MKKLIICAICMSCLASCYNTRILVGDVKRDEALTEVKRVWNDGFIVGLVPGKNAKMSVNDYLPDQKNYVVKTNQSFATMLVGMVTFGIYTPTQTKYYVPLKDVEIVTEEVQ